MPQNDLPRDDVSRSGQASTGDDPGTVSDPAMIERITRIAAEVDDDDFARQAPPPDLRARILSAAAAVQDEPASEAAAASAGVGVDEDAPADATVVPLEQRRRNMTRSIVIAVAASLVLLIGTGVLLTRGGSSPDPELVASATLEPLVPTDASADVRLVSDDGDLRLVLNAHDMTAAPSGHHYELWLLDPASSAATPVSLGPMTGSVTVPVPAEVDVDEFDVVDVSLQRDGQIEHSSESLLRGTLA